MIDHDIIAQNARKAPYFKRTSPNVINVPNCLSDGYMI